MRVSFLGRQVKWRRAKHREDWMWYEEDNR